jgi:hypothetical protein
VDATHARTQALIAKKLRRFTIHKMTLRVIGTEEFQIEANGSERTYRGKAEKMITTPGKNSDV